MFSEYYFFFYHGKHDINPLAFPDGKQNFESADDRNCIDGFMNSDESSVSEINIVLYQLNEIIFCYYLRCLGTKIIIHIFLSNWFY